MGKNLQIDYQPTLNWYINWLSSNYCPGVWQFFEWYIGQVSTLSWPTTYIFWLSTKCWLYTLWIISKMSARYQCSIRLSEVLVNYKAMWADFPVHLDQYISQVFNWPTVNSWTDIIIGWDYVHCIVVSRVDCTLLLPVYFQTDKLLKEILDSATSLLFELICVVHQVRSGLK